jgi:hypothetical protein
MRGFVEKKITKDDFWACWYALNARGWHSFSWGSFPSLVHISLYHRWYTKKDLMHVFFQHFFSTQSEEDVHDPDFIFNCTMNLLDAMKPFNDVFVDGFLDLSLHDYMSFSHPLFGIFDRHSQTMHRSKKLKVLLAFCAVWPLSLGGSYQKVSKRLISIINI